MSNREPDPGRTAEQQQQGLALAVIGSKGAPGASECAGSLAALAQRRWSTLLVECDLLGSFLACRLHTDPDSGSLLGVINSLTADRLGSIDELLGQWLTGDAHGWPPVLLGPPLDGRSRITGTALQAALSVLRRYFSLLVADVGWLVDDDSSTARAHAAVLAAADAVLLVAGPSEPQLQAAIRQLTHLLDQQLVTPERLRIACHQHRDSDAARRFANALAGYGLDVDVRLPLKPGAAQRAHASGRPLALVRGAGRYRALLEQLLEATFVGEQPHRRLRRPRLQIHTVNEVASGELFEEVALPWRSS